MRTKNDTLTLDGTDMTSNISSDAIWLGHVVNFSVQAIYTGSTPNGTLKLQASNDEGSKDNDIASSSITNWTDIPSETVTVTAAGSSLFNVENCGYRWFRLVWVDNTSTAGTLSARYNIKGI